MLQTLRNEIAQLPSDTATLRKFGWVVGGVFLVVGCWFWFRHKNVPEIWLTISIPLLLLGTFAPGWLKIPHRIWMSVAICIGMVISTLLLWVFFYLVVTPIGIAARIAGNDFLAAKRDPLATSYWIPREAKPRPRESYERQY